MFLFCFVLRNRFAGKTLNLKLHSDQDLNCLPFGRWIKDEVAVSCGKARPPQVKAWLTLVTFLGCSPSEQKVRIWTKAIKQCVCLRSPEEEELFVSDCRTNYGGRARKR
jgi:hypothetical protein